MGTYLLVLYFKETFKESKGTCLLGYCRAVYTHTNILKPENKSELQTLQFPIEAKQRDA